MRHNSKTRNMNEGTYHKKDRKWEGVVIALFLGVGQVCWNRKNAVGATIKLTRGRKKKIIDPKGQNRARTEGGNSGVEKKKRPHVPT